MGGCLSDQHRYRPERARGRTPVHTMEIFRSKACPRGGARPRSPRHQPLAAGRAPASGGSVPRRDDAGRGPISGIIVLGGALGVSRGQIVLTSAASRLWAAAVLAHKGPEAKLIFT